MTVIDGTGDDDSDGDVDLVPFSMTETYCTGPLAVGPLSVLHKCMAAHKSVKVYIRSSNYLRGICIGRLVCFDKHFNMVCFVLLVCYCDAMVRVVCRVVVMMWGFVLM